MMATDAAGIKRIAEDYCRTFRIGRVASRESVRCDADYHRAVADAFSRLESNRDALTTDAYGALRREVGYQFMALCDAGFTFIPFGDDEPDPYSNRSDVMRERLFNSGILYVYSGGADHPALTRRENWMFRAVHDVFGHAMHGYSFGPNGEESAYRCHRAMFSPLAGMALATETRGQNSWVNFGPFSHLPRADRPFAEQKSAIMAEEFQVAY